MRYDLPHMNRQSFGSFQTVQSHRSPRSVDYVISVLNRICWQILCDLTLLQEQEFHELYQSQIQAAKLISHSILVIQSYK